MCSRFELNRAPDLVAARFGLVAPPRPNRAEVRPTDSALVVAGGQGRLARWGLTVQWDKRPLINARAETLAQRPVFRRLLGHRVLIPATAWWEWQVAADGQTYTKMRLAKMRLGRADGESFALAGLLDGDCFVVVTCPPVPAIAHVHDRMPVIVPPEAEAAWADPAVPFAQAADVLFPYPGELIAVPDPDPVKAKTPRPVQGKPVQGELF